MCRCWDVHQGSSDEWQSLQLISHSRCMPISKHALLSQQARTHGAVRRGNWHLVLEGGDDDKALGLEVLFTVVTGSKARWTIGMSSHASVVLCYVSIHLDPCLMPDGGREGGGGGGVSDGVRAHDSFRAQIDHCMHGPMQADQDDSTAMRACFPFCLQACIMIPHIGIMLTLQRPCSMGWRDSLVRNVAASKPQLAIPGAGPMQTHGPWS